MNLFKGNLYRILHFKVIKILIAEVANGTFMRINVICLYGQLQNRQTISLSERMNNVALKLAYAKLLQLVWSLLLRSFERKIIKPAPCIFLALHE